MADVFRKSALERLSNPEQLDKVITVSKPVSWLALVGLAAGIVALVFWAIFGSLPTKQFAPGIVSNGEEGKMVECYVAYTDKEKIKTDQKAVVKSGDKSLDATVVEIIFDGTEISDAELALKSGETLVAIKLRLTDGTLTERSLVNVQIIIEETKPITMLFPGLKG
ncbi:MAG: hypothetical protein FWG14_08125 [Peptococcaceae bacterium]|nr:hypothetical protein [Peptococcaceae bacterium]